jgi:phosphoribosyl 1,2-cyclic phosphodiesterase
MSAPTLRVVSLFSGSKGNCTLIDTGCTRLLIDAGGSAKAICEALAKVGYCLSDIDAVFVTHEHGDHTCGLATLVKKHPVPVHMTETSARALSLSDGSPLWEHLVTHNGEFTLALSEDCRVEAFLAPHDSVCCVGYRVTCGSVSVGIATDLGYVTQRVYDRLRGCEAVVLEANHDRDMVRNGSYPASLKQRILSGGGHLSNDDCAEVAGALARSGTRAILLAHLSKENNTPSCALDTVKQAVDKYGVTVLAAAPDKPTVLV